MRGFNLLHQCVRVLLAFTLLSVHSNFIKAQAFPSNSTAPSSTMHSTTPPPPLTASDYSLCKTCICSGDSNRKVDCSKRGLTSIPVEELDEFASAGLAIAEIDLSSNDISLVRVRDFHSHGAFFVTIDLRSNRISEIDDKAFAHSFLEHLFVLQLGHNELKSIPDGALHGLHLNTLDLRDNKLNAVPKALRQTEQISKLHLQDNPLNNLPHDSFDGIPFVKTLDVSNCGLSAFEACQYEYNFFNNLEELYLDQNQITVINADHFTCHNDDINDSPRLAILKLLSVQNSGVRTIEERSFETMLQLERLYLNGNNLGVFKGRVFQGLQNIHELDLSFCNITDLKRVLFKQLGTLEKLYLDGNNIKVVHHRDFTHLENAYLRLINLGFSNIERIEGQPFENLTHLGTLNLENNKLDDRILLGFGRKGSFYKLALSHNNLTHIPNLPSSGFPHLRTLELEDNMIFEIRQQDLQDMNLLGALLLRGNKIQLIEEYAFVDNTKISYLDLDGLKMKHLPKFHLPKLHILHIKNGELESLPDNMCEYIPELQMIEAENNKIKHLPSLKGCKVESLAFANNRLTSLEYSTFENQHYLRLLIVDNNQISSISEGCFRDTGNLEYLHVKWNNLTTLPENIFLNTSLLVHVDLSGNHLEQLDDGLFSQNAKYLSILDLSTNELESFGTDVLPKRSQINKLNLSSNKLIELEFPSSGLLWLTEFFVEDNFDLYQVPDVVAYPNVTDIMYTYAYHCCIWSEMNRKPHTFVDHGDENNTADPTVVPTPEPLVQTTKEIGKDCVGGELTLEAQERWILLSETFNFTVKFLPNCNVELTVPDHNLGKEVPTFGPSGDRPGVSFGPALNCSPHPNDFSPCANLIDPWPLRAFVWFLWIVALLGNGAVLFISIATKERLEVYQFLICCLAFADFCMGVYLAFLAAVDIRTYGEISFYQSALYWQNGPGCKAAGFIAVFASELSVFILVLLTLERVYTIANAFNKNEQVKMKVATVAAIIAVLVSALLAALPLVGINSYSQVAVCLPYVTEKWTDKLYIGTLLSLHLIGFLIILCSYAYIFRSICKSPAAQQKKRDLSLAAAKIAILIVTAFVCWIPIVVIGYLALGDIKAVNTSQAKYLIVLVYPLNACLNPFIYAIFTRQFRQKLSVMLKRSSNDRVSSIPHSKRYQLKRGSSAFLPTTSPRNPLHPIQRPRSNSICLHLAMSNPSTPPIRSPPSLSPPPGVYMGRRASLPFSFGSSLRSYSIAQAETHGDSATSNKSSNNVSNAHPLNIILGCGQAADLPADAAKEESPVRIVETNLGNSNSLGGSQDSSNKQLPGIPEEQEDENQSVCSADFQDAQEEIREDTIEAQSDNSACETSNTLQTREEGRRLVEEELRDSIDSAYSGCNSITPDIIVTGPQSSPVHSCSLSRDSESFSSYDLAISDSDARDITPTPLTKLTNLTKEASMPLDRHQSDLDTFSNCKSSSHESRDKPSLAPAKLEILPSISDTQLSIVGSETSI